MSVKVGERVVDLDFKGWKVTGLISFTVIDSIVARVRALVLTLQDT